MHSFDHPRSIWLPAKVSQPDSASAKALSRTGRRYGLIAALLCSQMATAAFAFETGESRVEDPRASTSVVQCHSLAEISEGIVSEGGRLIQMTPEQFQFARGMFVASRPGSMRIPPGDRALMGETAHGDIGMIFVDGDNACGLSLLSASAVKLLMAVGSGKVTHAGSGT